MARTKAPVFNGAVDRLRELVGAENFIDVGYKAATPLGVSPATLARATKFLRDNEYFNVFYFPVEQRQNGKRAILKVLTPPGTTFADLYYGRARIKPITKEKV